MNELQASTYCSCPFVMQALDSDSRGRQFATATRLGLDVRCASLVVHLAMMPSELIAAPDLLISGTAVLARLKSRPPYTMALPLPATSWHTVISQVPVRNCSSPPKVYTNMTGKVSGLVVGLSAGLEPALGALKRAVQRVILPTSVTGDGRAVPADPAAPGLPWWDKLRTQWRGRGRLVLADAAIVIAISREPAAEAHHDRVAATFRKLELATEPEGRLQVAAAGASVDAFLAHVAACSRPGAPSLRVPLLKAAEARLALVAAFVLPVGRDPGSHHVFPALDEAAPAAKQGPIDLTSLFRSEAFSLSLTFSVESVTDCRRVCAQGGEERLDESTHTILVQTVFCKKHFLPSRYKLQVCPRVQRTAARLPLSKTVTIFISEEAIAVLQDLKAAFASPPPFLRRSLRRSEDFWHPRSVLPMATPGLHHLLRSVSLTLKGHDLAIQHHVVSTGDPGALHFLAEQIECVLSFSVQSKLKGNIPFVPARFHSVIAASAPSTALFLQTRVHPSSRGTISGILEAARYQPSSIPCFRHVSNSCFTF
jgi:hypothetical protein